MKPKLLITGGSGFVAYHLIEEALLRGYEVYVSVRPSSITTHLKNYDIKFTSINFADIQAITNELKEKQYNYIIHSAGTTKAGSQQEYDRVNATYAANLAKAATDANIPLKKFVFVSSLAAAGPSLNAVTSSGYSNSRPVTEYGKSKLLAEQLLSKISDLPLVVFRPTAVYGPREKDIFIILRLISKGLEPYIGNQPQELTFIYVKDLSRLIVHSLTSSVNGNVYNVSDGNVYNRYALGNISKKILGKKTWKVYLPLPVVKMIAGVLEIAGSVTGKIPALNRKKIKELTASWPCGIDAAKTDLDFNPEYDLKGGLTETFRWYKEHNWI